MARQLVWAFAALMLVSTSGRAAELCDATQQRGGTPPAGTGAKPDQRGDDTDKDRKAKPGHQGSRLWWIDAQSRAELGISDQQSAAVEHVWQKSLPKLRELRLQLEKLEEALSQLVARADADEAAVIAQIDRVETARAEGNKARSLMIHRMHKVLTVEQRAKVKALMDRRDDRRDGGRRGGGSSSR